MGLLEAAAVFLAVAVLYGMDRSAASLIAERFPRLKRKDETRSTPVKCVIEASPSAATSLLTRDEARRIAANITKLLKRPR